MDLTVVREASHPLLPQAVHLHYDALSYRSTITAFGEPFLYELYRALLDEGNGFVVVAHEGTRLIGFILGCVDSSRMMSVVPRRPLRFFTLMAPAMLRRPGLWPRMLQTLLYTRKEASDVAAELVVIAVVDDRRGAGIGKQMLAALETELASRGVDRFKVTVHQAMAASNRFYTQNAFQLTSTFDMYGVPWNLYVKKVAPTEKAA
ncbi:MAG: family N-acetyltransferase [Myxococcales bacterium]|nr:family N-acetyltransferase [Myxococcales bacterium]